MKIMTVLGTRPEIIRLSRIISLLDQYSGHVLVNTGQNHNYALNNLFFEELKIRRPDYAFEITATTPMQQIGQIFCRTEEVVREEKPDRLLLLGDTNSALTAFVAKRNGIPVFHLEAGNRCYDDRVPEEINRRLIDHCSDILMPYTERGRTNLIREGVAPDRIFVTGNPILEVLDYYRDRIEQSAALVNLGLKPRKYFLVTLHRAENVDLQPRLATFIRSLNQVAADFQLPVICGVHPHTRSQLAKMKESLSPSKIALIDPLGLFDFVRLEQSALFVLTDSGTVQEECCLLGVPCVTLRDVTERPETIEAGGNALSGCNSENLSHLIKLRLKSPRTWNPPPEYLKKDVSGTVLNIVLSHYQF